MQERAQLESSVIEHVGGPVTLRGATLVREQFEGERLSWHGTVYCFTKDQEEGASRCYAWTRYLAEFGQARSVIVSAGPRVQTPRDAVRSFLLEGGGKSWMRAG